MKNLIIINDRLPAEAKNRLSSLGDLICFSSSGITYESISGHPDVFFCETPEGLIAAPNTPNGIISKLARHKVTPKFGNGDVGMAYPDTAHYNAVVAENYIIHNHEITDPLIKTLAEGKSFIQVAQGYTRCNLLDLGNGNFITSDKGIEKVLVNLGFQVLYVSPTGIELNGFPHGFIGGCCGILRDSILISGSFKHYEEGEAFKSFANGKGFQILELYDGPLVDGGGVICFQT
ncbi:MAG: hypothetical protein HXX13_16650 [Bacteroidetes bacterium]|nr:hypothetical protein [Bacteroidota bacterium]